MNRLKKNLAILLISCNSTLFLAAMEDSELIFTELAAQEQYSSSPKSSSKAAGERPSPVKALPAHRSRSHQPKSLPSVLAASKNLAALHSPLTTKKRFHNLELQIASPEVPKERHTLELELINDQNQITGENMIVSSPRNAGEKISNLIEFIQQNIDLNLIPAHVNLEECFTISMLPAKTSISANPYANRFRTEAQLRIKRELAQALLNSPLLPQLLKVDQDADARIIAAIID